MNDPFDLLPNRKNNNKLMLIASFSLATGVFIYASFRSKSLLFFDWFEKINLSFIILQIRRTFFVYKDFLPNWFLFSLPNGLYTFSYTTFMIALWGNESGKIRYIWFFIIPFVMICSEFGQSIGFIKGYFDFTDLIFYILGTISPLFLFSKCK